MDVASRMLSLSCMDITVREEKERERKHERKKAHVIVWCYFCDSVGIKYITFHLKRGKHASIQIPTDSEREIVFFLVDNIVDFVL